MIYRSHRRLLAGVCAGIAEHFKVDTKKVRLGFVIATLICGLIPHLIVIPFGIYAILALVMPLNPKQNGFSYFDLFKILSGQTKNTATNLNKEYTKNGRKIIKDARERDVH